MRLAAVAGRGWRRAHGRRRRRPRRGGSARRERVPRAPPSCTISSRTSTGLGPRRGGPNRCGEPGWCRGASSFARGDPFRGPALAPSPFALGAAVRLGTTALPRTTRNGACRPGRLSASVRLREAGAARATAATGSASGRRQTRPTDAGPGSARPACSGPGSSPSSHPVRPWCAHPSVSVAHRASWRSTSLAGAGRFAAAPRLAGRGRFAGAPRFAVAPRLAGAGRPLRSFPCPRRSDDWPSRRRGWPARSRHAGAPTRLGQAQPRVAALLRTSPRPSVIPSFSHSVSRAPAVPARHERGGTVERPLVQRNPGGDLLSQGVSPQVPSARAVFTSVFGMGTGVSPPRLPPETCQNLVVLRGLHSEHELTKIPSPRPISTGRLNTSPCVHLRPINLVVFQGPYPVNPVGDLISRKFSRLDAFSAYPFRRSPTSRAPGGTTGTRELRPSRSSRTRDSSPQISYARTG